MSVNCNLYVCIYIYIYIYIYILALINSQLMYTITKIIKIKI